MSAAALLLKVRRSRKLLGDRMTMVEWDLSCDAANFDEVMVALIASSYISDAASLSYPQADLANKLPPKGSTSRKGDFGEILAGVLFSHRVGYDVPFQRLTQKPVAGATMQGADVLGLCLDYGEEPKPVVVEVKFRGEAKPAAHLAALRASLENVGEDYLASSWVAAVGLMDSHPNFEKAFALSAAQQMARLIEPDEPTPEHARQAVIVLGSGEYTAAKVKEHWGTSPPVSHLHVINVPDAEAVIDRLFDKAAKLNYSDAASGVPALIGQRGHRPGLGTTVSSTDAMAKVQQAKADDLAGVIEAALWLLADWDGMATARARRIIESNPSDTAVGLASILTGAGVRAAERLKDDPELARFAQAVLDAWDLKIDAGALSATTQAVVDVTADPTAEAVRYVGAAVAHRLPRHPRSLTSAAGATGTNVQHVVAEMLRYGRKAFWPSQAKALAAGLLDQGRPAMAIKMPTSAGKSLLIELAAADTLDGFSDGVVAVLGPTKALVSQLSRGLRDTLPKSVAVRSSSGGLDFDLDDVSTGLLTEPGVAVMTPERFDLEWRRTLTGDSPQDLDAIRLLVVDEAHLINATKRGARLELVIARALRRDIRIVMLSSQFPEVSTFGTWIEGTAVESTWTPTWLERFVYFTDKDALAGMIQAEAGDAQKRIALMKDTKANKKLPLEPGRSLIDRRCEAAALAQASEEGLVVLYSNNKNHIEGLVSAVAARSPMPDEIVPGLEELASSVEASAPEHAALLRQGVGVHHADIPRQVRQAVEWAAREDWLRYVVCTSTLLEGVDFPARSVIAVYPTQTTKGKVEVSRLRNLAGRAGRGGRFTSGTLIVMVKEKGDVEKWLRGFRAGLPSTQSELMSALNYCRSYGTKLDLLDPPDDDKLGVVPSVDAVILAAIIEGAVIDGDLRARLELVLGRTLWWTTTTPGNRDSSLAAAERRAAALNSFIGAEKWKRSFYRTGLSVGSSIRLRDAIVPQVGTLVPELTAAGDGTALLIRLASTVAPLAKELSTWADLDPADVEAALGMWIDGSPVESIETAQGAAWKVMEDGLDTLLPWVLTAVVECIATAADRPELTERAHSKLGIARVRYGVPDMDLCDFVRRGEDRTLVASYAVDFEKAGHWFVGEKLDSHVGERIAAAKAVATTQTTSDAPAGADPPPEPPESA